jgi:HlyD family secretion protein
MKPQQILVGALLLSAAGLGAFLAFGLGGGQSPMLSGYVEGEPLYPASPVAGRLVQLNVKRGDVAAAGTLLFAVDPAQIAAQRDEAASQLVANQALAKGARTGQRPAELQQIQADLNAARAVLNEAEKSYARTQPLYEAGAASKASVDSALAARDRAKAQVASIEKRLQVAQLGQRTEQVTNAEQRVVQAEASLGALEARLADLSPVAPSAGRVEDVFFQPGEWVPANQAVMSFIPDDRVRLRFFAPQTEIAAYRIGASVTFSCDGCAKDLSAKITYVSPRPEFTPPVIYSREARDRMVFMVEAHPETSAGLTPGQPIDVQPLKAAAK